MLCMLKFTGMTACGAHRKHHIAMTASTRAIFAQPMARWCFHFPIRNMRHASTENSSTLNLTDVKHLMKEYRTKKLHRKIIDLVRQLHLKGHLNHKITMDAMRTLKSMDKTELCPQLLDIWELTVMQQNTTNLITGSIALIKFFASDQQEFMLYAERVARTVGVCLDEASGAHTCSLVASMEMESESVLRAYSSLLSELVVGYANHGHYSQSLACLSALMEHELFLVPPDAPRETLKRFVSGASVGDTLACFRTLVVLADNQPDGGGNGDGGGREGELMQVMCSAFLRDVEFVAGAVSMSTLPAASCGEAAFIGRSNVGKSSLVNMLANRSGLAFTGKKPGKTAEFNYFEVRGAAAGGRGLTRFHLVDLPGVGYALKSRELRANWTSLLRAFVQQRSALRVVFHLVDSRHGLLDADEECLELLDALPPAVRYVVVLTKVDLQRGDERDAQAQAELVDRIYGAIARRTRRVVPILFTSSRTKVGGTAVLSTLLDAVCEQGLMPAAAASKDS